MKTLEVSIRKKESSGGKGNPFSGTLDGHPSNPVEFFRYF